MIFLLKATVDLRSSTYTATVLKQRAPDTDRHTEIPLYVFWYEFKLLHVSLLLAAEPISLRPVLWKVENHRHFEHFLSLHVVSVSVLKRFPFLFDGDLQRTKGEGLLYLLDSRGGGG